MAAPASLSLIRFAFCSLHALYHMIIQDSSAPKYRDLQENGSYMVQTVGEPRQELFNQVVFSNHMCSFQ